MTPLKLSFSMDVVWKLVWTENIWLMPPGFGFTKLYKPLINNSHCGGAPPKGPLGRGRLGAAWPSRHNCSGYYYRTRGREEAATRAGASRAPHPRRVCVMDVCL